MNSEEHNVDDIIAQYDNHDVDEPTTEINVDDLLNDDLVSSALASPPSTDEIAKHSESRPQLTSSLPAPVAPNSNNSHAPNLPSTISPRYTSIDEDVELDIETIINDSKMETDDLLDDNMNDINDALLEFDPDNISSTTLLTSNDMIMTDTNKSTNPTKYSDIDLESISSLIKREEIRMKQRMEVGNYVMIEPLTKRMKSNKTNDDQSTTDDEDNESFFKLELRSNISTTLKHHRSEYGVPTVVKSHTKFIAMGMTNGCVFIFDHFEQLRVELTCSDARALRMGSVTCLDFNYNGTLLIVGYHGGQLVLWDIINNRELKKIKDAHVSPITFVMFYRRGALRIASCDSNGIMFTWSFSKIFFSYNVDRATLFNGKRAGVLYDIELYKPTTNTTATTASVFDSLSLCAVANKESVFFVLLEPPFTLKQTILLPNASINELKRGALPMLSWRLLYEGNTNRNPVLAVGSGTVIQLIEIFIKEESQFHQTRDPSLIRMRGIGQIQLKKLVVAMRWLNGDNLILLSANDEILICSGSPMCVTETLNHSSSPDLFIRHHYFGKHIVCFKHCFETIGGLDRTGQTNKLLISTASNIVSVHCMTWYDRIEKLIREGEWIRACCLIISFWNAYSAGEIKKSASTKRLLGKMDGYIVSFCDFVVQSSAISTDELESFGGVAMDYCVCLHKTGALLFDRVYNILLNNGGREIFFELLESYVLNDRITTLPPEFLCKFADFLVSKSKELELQQIILHLTPQSFDIHRIVSICRSHELFIALCFLYNTACLDYAAPIGDMFYKIIRQKSDANVIESRSYELILYLKYVMNGTSFPWCNILSTQARLKAKQEIFSVLFDESQQYQILRHLLATDLRQVLVHIIKCGFDDQYLFRRAIKSSKSSSSSSSPPKIAPPPPRHQRRTSIQIRDMLSNAQSAVMNGAKWLISSPPPSNNESQTDDAPPPQLDATIELKSKQEMLNVLVDIIVYEMSSDNEIFYSFCTPLLASGECEVSIDLLKSVLHYLFGESLELLNKADALKKSTKKEKDDKTQRELDRLRVACDNLENTILILLSRKMDAHSDSFDVDELLRCAALSKFHKVQLYLHRECGNHSAVIDSYLADGELAKQVFDYIHNLFYDIGRRKLMKIVLARLSQLILISSERTAELVFEWFAAEYFDETVAALSACRRTQYVFFAQIVHSMQSLKHKKADAKLTKFESLLVANEFKLKRSHHELYIRLLCEFCGESVLPYLSSNSDEFSIDLVARYCDKFSILDASSYLRERSGDMDGALHLILQSIGQRVSGLWDVFCADFGAKLITAKSLQNNTYYMRHATIQRIVDELNMAIGLCRRSQQKSLWNNLLDACLVSQRQITADLMTPSFRARYPMSEIRYLMKQVVNEIVTQTLTVMMTEKNIDLCDMFDKFATGDTIKYEYYRDTIDVMLSTYKYETQMLKTANNLFRSGVHKQFVHHCDVGMRATQPIRYECNICHATSKNHFFRLRLFCCGHLFHQDCLTNNSNDICPICRDNKQKQSAAAINHSHHQNKKKEEKKQIMVDYAKKLNQCKKKLKYRQLRTAKHIKLALAPKNKTLLTKSNQVNMHKPVANWQIMCQNNRRDACVIQID